MFTLVITQGESCEKCRKNGKDRDPQKKRKKFVEIDRGVFGFFELLKVRKIAVRETGAAEFLRQKKTRRRNCVAVIVTVLFTGEAVNLYGLRSDGYAVIVSC